MMTGQIVHHYKILEKLGEGGMGVVYKAIDTRLDRTVALKFLRTDRIENKKNTERFLREAKVISKLDHPNIAVIHEISETADGHPFICMAYYEGSTLFHLLKSAPFSLSQVLDIATQILRGLDKSHAAGIIHRDIKPGNIVFSQDGNLKIVDFGVARLTGDISLTAEGKNPGTLPYMSPEQMRGEEVDSRSDLFSFGIILYEMITGQHPFAGEYEQVIGYKLLNENPAPVRSVRPDIPRELDEIVSRCLEKDCDLRYASASAILNDLENVIQIHQLPLSAAGAKGVRPVHQLSGEIHSIAGSLPGRVFGLTLVLVIVFFVVLAGNPFGPPDDDDDPPLPAARHLVVLPFTNYSENEISQSFCDGLLETLNNSLTLLQPIEVSYWVVAASEVREQNISSATAANKVFNATIAVTGSLQRISEDRVRLILNLVDAETSTQLKSDRIDVHEWELFRLQDEAVIMLAGMLGIDMDPATASRLIAGSTQDPRAYEYYLEGKGSLQQFERLENIMHAIEQFNRATLIDNRFALAYAGLGEAYLRRFIETRETEWVRPAIEHARFALELDDTHPDIHITFAMISRETGNFEDARETLERLVEREPANTNIHGELALTYEQTGEFAKAEEAYLKAIDLQPTYWAYHNALGRFYYFQGRLEDAAQKFIDVTEINPGNVWGYTNLGAVYFGLNKFAEARNVFEYSLAIEPTQQAYSNLGTLYYYYDASYEDAVYAYELALTYNDSDFFVWGNLGSAYKYTGNKEKSLEAFTRAAKLAEENLKVNPRDAGILYRLAGYYVMLEENERAQTYAERALEEATGSVNVLGRIAIVYERLGERDKALRLLEEAVKAGFSIEDVERDPDLTDLREDERYTALALSVTNR